MASVKPLLDEQGTKRGYKVRYRSGGKARSKTFPLKAKGQAEAFATTIEADKLTGSELDHRALRLSVKVWAGEWVAVQSHSEGSALRVDDALGPFLDLFGDLPLGKVRQSHIKAWAKARRADVSASTVKTDFTWVRGLFAAAVADRLIRFSPCHGVKLEAPGRRQMCVPEPAGVLAIAERLPPSWALLGPLGARTGLRPGELLGLCEEQVDWLRREITVDRQMLRGKVVLLTKTAASLRTVPLEAETATMLAAHLVAHPLGPPVPVVSRNGDVVSTGRLIFHRDSGAPVNHRSADDTWKRQAAAAGLPGVRIHDMRHFFASTLIREGASVVLVSELLGHSRPSITADVYAHEFADRDERARDLIAAVWSDRPRPERVLSAT